MADVAEELSKAREHARPEWTAERERAVRIRVERSLVRQRQLGVVMACAVLTLLVVGGFAVSSRLPVRALVAPAASLHDVSPPLLLQLEDGSAVTGASADARVEPVEVGARSVAVRLTAGSARFSVTPNAERTFRVLAGGVAVTVLGTVFTVGLEPGGVRVRVERGHVRVAWPAGERDLAVGEQALVTDTRAAAPAPVSDVPPSAPAAAPLVDAAAPPATASPSLRNQSGTASSWRALAQDGDYARAFVRMTAEGSAAVKDEPGDLLLAADVARLGGHPEKAVSSLERVVSAHARDSRAPLAAFTLGRTLLDQLGRPREAAQAFGTARKLDPHGALAQDALAREVESWSRAGEAALAHERAGEYVALYPKGRRLAAVRRLGALD